MRLGWITVNDFQRFLQGELDKREMTAKDFAAEMGVSGSSVTRVLNGSQKPGDDFLVKLSNYIRVDIGVLMSIVHPTAYRTASHSREATILLQLIEQLPDHLRESYITLLKDRIKS